MKLHAKQQEAIRTDRTAVVSAGAGSGKTMVLTERYVRLITEGADVEGILTLTFTRKAAAEMRERIQMALAGAARDSDRSPAARERAERAIARFPQARITTLDSFCNTVVREAARSYGITPEFTTDEQRVRELLLQECLGFLAEHRDNPGMQAWLQDFSVERVLHNGLIPLAAEEFSIAKPRNWAEYTEEIIEESLQQAIEIIRRIEELGSKVVQYPHDDSKFLTGMIRIIRDHELLPGQDTSSLLEVAEAMSLLTHGVRKQGRYRAEVAEWIEPARELHDLLKLQVPPAVNAVRIVPYLRALGNLCDELQQRIIERKRASGILSFTDVAGLALHALLTQPDLRRYHAGRISHIMIDEFQDNNQLQQDLLFTLALKDPADSRVYTESPQLEDVSEEKLFFVGDEKQSIFRFRNADVSIFRSLSERVGEYGGSTIDLRVNYRSEPRIIALFNQLFPQIFGDAGQEYEARFEPLEPRASTKGITPCIEVWLNESSSEDDADSEGVLNSSASEAEYLASWLAQQVETRALLVPGDNGELRPAEYRDCAVLFRSGGSVMDFEEAMRRHGVPYNSMIMRSLFLEAPANDIYAALQLAVYPEDRNAYAAVLRSPFVGLDDYSFFRLMLEHDLPVFPDDDCLRELGLPQAEIRKIQQGRSMHRFIQAQYHRLTPVELLDYLWFDCGYRWFLLSSPANHAYVEHFEYLREWFSRPGLHLLPLLQELRDRLGSNTKYDGSEIVREQENAVTILTVHSSKGLGFPVVILARAGQRPNSDGGSPLGHYKGRPVFMLSDPDSSRQNRTSLLVHNAAEEEALQQQAELKRLLYVALTRVKQHLVISGIDVAKTAPKEGSDRIESTFGGLLRTALGLHPETGEVIDCGTETITVRWIPRVPREVLWRGKSLPARDAAEGIVALQQAAVPAVDVYPGTISVSELSRQLREGDVLQAYTPSGVALHLPGTAAAEAINEPDDALSVDPLLERIGWEDRFGSLCHFILEQRAVRPPGPGSTREIADLAASRFQSRLAEDEWQPIWREAWGLSERWFAGAQAARLGILPGSALKRGEFRAGGFPQLLTEREFLMQVTVDGLLYRVRGIMDVTVENAETALVLDYKTDKHWDPLSHWVQLALYREALQGICGKPTTACLAALRSGRVTELDA